MANYQTLKSAIQDVVKTNGNNEIKGALLQQSLLAMINSLGLGYQFMGLATPSMKPETPDAKVFYIASTPGVYKNFGGKSVYDGETAILIYTNQWYKSYTLRSDVILLSYWGPNASAINALPEGSFFYNTYSNKIGITTGVAGQWNEATPKYNALYIYNGALYVFNGSTLVSLTPSIIIPSLNRCSFYININGEHKNYIYNSITELLNIPQKDCVISGLWNGGEIANSVVFLDANLEYISGFNVTGRYEWKVSQVTIPTGAKYMLFQQQSGDNVIIETTENLCTGLDYVVEKGLQGINKTQNERIATIERLLKGEPVVYDANAYLSSSGTLVNYAAGRATTEYYPLSDLFTYLVTGQGASDSQIFAYYDENKQKISTYQSTTLVTDVDIETLLPKPANAKYVRFSSWPITGGYGAKISPKQIYSEPKWGQKKWVVIGDSLTEHNVRTPLNYHNYVAEKTGISVVNLGISGTGYGRGQGTNNAFYQRINNVPLDTDVITIFGSFNDLGAGLSIGNIDDSGTTTLCGCINKTIDDIQSRIPLVNLGIVTPTPWSSTQPTVAGNSTGENYVNAIIAICKYRSIPCLDLYHCSNLRPWDASFRALAYKRDGSYSASTSETPNAIQVTAGLLDYVKTNGVPNAVVGDWVLMSGGGVHPDEDGHKMIASRFESFLDSLLLSK